jgi:hypothetical protein
MRKVFSEMSPEELRGLEMALTKVGKRAAAVMEQRVSRDKNTPR